MDLSSVSAFTDSAEVAAAIEARANDDQTTRQALWQRLTELWAALCRQNRAVAEVVALVASEAEFTLLQMREAPQLDLDHLSPGEDYIA